MESTIQTNLCKGLRACGIPRKEAHEILNIVEKWYHENGVEWTNSRIKDLRQWYETTLAGEPTPPSWFKHSKDGLPLGIWSWVFKLKPAKALGVLSLNTVFYEDSFTETQQKKFLQGLAGDASLRESEPYWPDLVPAMPVRVHLPKAMPPIQFPTVFDMTGSIPVHDGRSTVRPNEHLGLALKALRSSWESVPQVTFDFLVSQNLLGYMPPGVIGNDYQLELDKPHDRCVGRVSVLQQAQLKARVIGNPNRVLQATLEPLKSLFMETLKKLPSDVTHSQESGVDWIQDQLRQGIELAGSDLTSASDLLDVSRCFRLVDETFGFRGVEGYEDYAKYFYEVCRSSWWCPALNREVQWEQGTVLGTGPSFGLLSLTNNAACLAAVKAAKAAGQIPADRDSFDCFRVVGDDVVMLSQMEGYYTSIIWDLGGVVNRSKTLVSDRVAEFAGRVITPDSSFLKAIKYSEPSDNSFMSYMAQLGDQAKYLLKTRQRQVYNLLKEVPGVVVPGPWMPDSYGVSLGMRYAWYLEEVEPVLDSAEPDQRVEDYKYLLLKADYSLRESDRSNEGLIVTDRDESLSQVFDEPFIDEGYLPSEVTPSFRRHGDPRLTNGKSLLDVLEQHIEEKGIMPFVDWRERNSSLPPFGGSDEFGDPDSSHESSAQSEETLKQSLSKASTLAERLRLLDRYDRERKRTKVHRKAESRCKNRRDQR